MNNLIFLRSILQTEPTKRIGTISELNTGSAVVTDFLDRRFKVTVPDDLDLVAGDAVIFLSTTIIGKTKIESNPNTYLV